MPKDSGTTSRRRGDSLNNVGPAVCSEIVISCPSNPPTPRHGIEFHNLKCSVLKAFVMLLGVGRRGWAADGCLCGTQGMVCGTVTAPAKGMSRWAVRGRERGKSEHGHVGRLASWIGSLRVCALWAILIFLLPVCALLKIPCKTIWRPPPCLSGQFFFQIPLKEPSLVEAALPGPPLRKASCPPAPPSKTLGFTAT